MCHALHDTETNKDMTYTCNKCSSSNAKWHCSTCDVSRERERERERERLEFQLSEAEFTTTTRWEKCLFIVCSLLS